MSRTINFSIDDGEILIMRDKVNAAKIIGSTIKVWLNTDNLYEFNYEKREKAKEDFAKLKEYINEDDEKIINEKLIEKAATWFVNRYQVNGYLDADDIVDFKKYMEDKQ